MAPRRPVPWAPIVGALLVVLFLGGRAMYRDGAKVDHQGKATCTEFVALNNEREAGMVTASTYRVRFAALADDGQYAKTKAVRDALYADDPAALAAACSNLPT